MKKILTLWIFTALFLLFISSIALATEFELTLVIKNKSDEWLKYVLKKGRILELAQIESSFYQSIIITEGEGLILVPPFETVERKIKGVCLHKGLHFAKVGNKINFTPFVGSQQLIEAGDNQKKVHEITNKPSPTIIKVMGKGYSDEEKNNVQIDRKEAFVDAVTDAALQAGVEMKPDQVRSKLNILESSKSAVIDNKTIKVLRIIHEDYETDSGQYLFIAEFEFIIPPPEPEIYY